MTSPLSLPTSQAKVSNFNRFWLGQTVSLLGSAVTMFALPTLAVLVLHASAVEVGGLTALETLPFAALSLLAGVLADRISRRHIMIVADIVRLVALASVPLAAVAGHLSMAQLYGVALVSGCGSAFFGVAYQSFLPVLVPAEDLADANAKLEFSNSGSMMAGNALVGVLIQWIGAAFAIAVDALSYAVSVASLALIPIEERPQMQSPLTLRQAGREIAEGLKVVFVSADLRWIMGATATINFGSGMINAVFLIYAYRSLHLSPGPLGLINGLAEVGFIGAIFAVRIRSRFGLRQTLIGSLLLSGFAMFAILFAGLAIPYVVLLIQGALMAISIPIYNVNQISYRQSIVDVRLQGRMNATMRTFVGGAVPLGAAFGGWLGAAIGVSQTIAVAAVLGCVAALWILPLREREYAKGAALAAPSP
jgi:MFS family permease